jgi:cytochrome c
MKCAVVKILGSVLFAVVSASVAYGAGSVVIHPTPLAKNVFVVDASTLSQPATPTPVASTEAPAAAAPVALPPIAELLAKADPAAGEKFAKVCATCHSFGKGEAAKMGPNLYGVIGLKHAHMAGFAYSDAMKALADKDWTFEALNHFLFNPKAAVPGTKMPFAGIKSDSDRANVIAWLRTVSDKPEPLPTK